MLYARGLITAPNLVLAGIVGSGKSSLAKSLYTRSLPFGRRVYVPAVVEPMSVRAFVITWNKLGGLCAHTDPAAIAGKLASEEAEMFFTVIDQWIDFADRLREALDRLGSDGEAE